MINYTQHFIQKYEAETDENILVALAYFDLFNYPLTKKEIFIFLKNKIEYESLDSVLQFLVDTRAIYKIDNFYSLKNDIDQINRRKEGNKKAAKLMKRACFIGRLLSKFPYIKGIGISGSLSKNFADEFSDIDFFIITSKNRLWIARTMLHGLKKLSYLFKMQHSFCMNYFVDELEIEIAEKNIFTAIELETLIPLYGNEIFEQFYTANSWSKSFFPNKTRLIQQAKPIRTPLMSKLLEFIFNSKTGDAIDNKLMEITSKRWLKKTAAMKVNSHGDVLSLATGKHFSKPNPNNFQSKLLSRFECNVSLMMHKYERLKVS